MRGNFTTDRCGKLNPNYKDGRKGTRLYSIYRGMITRSRNNSRNHIVKLNGIERPLIEWAEIYKINYKTVRDRLKRGWNYEKALTEPVETKFRRKVGGMEDGIL